MSKIYRLILIITLGFNLSYCASAPKESPDESGDEVTSEVDSGETSDAVSDSSEEQSDSSEAATEDSSAEDSATSEVADSNQSSEGGDADLLTEEGSSAAAADNQSASDENLAESNVADNTKDASAEAEVDPFASESPQSPSEVSSSKAETASTSNDFGADSNLTQKQPEADPFSSNSSSDTSSFAASSGSSSSISTPTQVDSEPTTSFSSNNNSRQSVGGDFNPVTIQDFKYVANEGGGTLVIEATGPITFNTRQNEKTQQLIVEVPNAQLPDRFKRGLNTKEIQGAIGSIDAYQASNNSARFVIQLRSGSAFPGIQQEGNRLLISSDFIASASSGTMSMTDSDNDGAPSVFDEKALKSLSLDEYLAGNNEFFGRKISLEMNDIEVKEALTFLTEESGANIVISDDIKGKLTLKLRQVPWDQALVVIMKAKQLGYSRSGNVIRIAPIKDLKQEEADSIAIAQERKNNEPLKVRVMTVNYASIKDIEEKIKPFLTKGRGQVIGDARTNNLVVTDTEDALQRVDKLIRSLDIQPPQVLIEGKIVEAAESFQRYVGINWGLSGKTIDMGSQKLNPALTVNPGGLSSDGLNFNLNFGTLDVFGDLNVALSLSELEDKVKVISSPRVLVLSNEQANISQSTKVPIKKLDTSATGQQTTTFTYQDLQLKLDVTPQITTDSSVIMKMNIKRDVQGAVNSVDGSFAINSREASSRVLVRNGQTAVIGGVYQSDATQSESGVPFLKDIPLIGRLFKGSAVSKEKRELLIFMTPRILGINDSVGARKE